MKLSSRQSNVIRRFSAFHTPLARWEGRVWDGDVPSHRGDTGGFHRENFKIWNSEKCILAHFGRWLCHDDPPSHTNTYKEGISEMKYSTFDIKVHFFVKLEKQFENNVLKWFVFNDKLKVWICIRRLIKHVHFRKCLVYTAKADVWVVSGVTSWALPSYFLHFLPPYRL